MLFSFSTTDLESSWKGGRVTVSSTDIFFFWHKEEVILLTCKVALFLGIKYSKATQCHYQSHKYYCSNDTTYVKVICNYKT